MPSDAHGEEKTLEIRAALARRTPAPRSALTRGAARQQPSTTGNDHEGAADRRALVVCASG
ncbi:hypothetical protein [Streptomyces sp. MK7]|uniref:hypothetical protein n=1 Tax=Streptomyces sp. MK7 TaxID=3067635 RepID=UPI002930C3EA|nr:hypothetical protein [Streptomyces sp. MK7]